MMMTTIIRIPIMPSMIPPMISTLTVGLHVMTKYTFPRTDSKEVWQPSFGVAEKSFTENELQLEWALMSWIF